jgi:hypothetical protein
MFKFNRNCCDAVAGNTRAGKFLNQLVFWLNSPKAPVFNGHRWVAFTREQWAERTGLTIDQIKYLLMQLLADGLIIREQHKWGGKVPNFIRLSTKAIEALYAAQAKQKSVTQVAEKSVTLFKPEDINEEDKKTASGFAVATPEAKKFDKTPGEEESACLSKNSGYHPEVGKMISNPEGQGGPEMATASEIVATILANSKKPIETLKPDKVYSLVHVWNEHFKTKGKVAPAVTDKVRGQLARLIKIWPKGEAPAVLQHTLSNWFDFNYAAEKDFNGFKSPDMPEMNHLVKYQHVAVTLYKKSKLKATASKPVAKPEPVQLIAQKPAEPVEDDKPMTMAELQAMEEAELQAAS